MSLLRRRRVESRATTFQNYWGAGADQRYAGDPLSLVPLFAAQRIIIDAVSSTPLHAYRERDGITEKVPRQPPLLTTPVWGTPATWKAQAVASLLADGNAFGLVTSRGTDGWPTSLVWLDPRHVTIEDDNGLPAYLLDQRPIDSADIVHIPWIVPPGSWRGLNPISAFRSTLETGQHAQLTARDWFANGAIPSGHMKNTQLQLDPAQTEELKARFKASVANREVLLTGNDWDYSTIGIPADQIQFIETLKLSATQIAVIYGVPPEEIGGETGSSLTYKTLEQTELRFNSRVVQPWAVRIEQALSTLMPRPVFARFNLDATVRSDSITRAQVHEINLRTGIETLDEGRALENRRPLTAAEKEALKPPAPAPAPPAAPEEEDDDDPTD